MLTVLAALVAFLVIALGVGIAGLGLLVWAVERSGYQAPDADEDDDREAA